MTEHYFTERPTSELKTKILSATIRNHTFEFTTVSGVFSFGRVDRGSIILAENAIVESDWKVLDLGCGWGVIGIVIKKVFPETDVTITDTNIRAIKTARLNAKRNNVKPKVLHGTTYKPVEKQQFDTILLNPPMKAGRELCYKMIEQSIKHLVNRGILQVVAFHNRGGKMLENKMKEVFGNVRTIVKKSGFRVYVSSRN
jgi:16S rRNA (guanine1207-N2)-methyltransferase